MNVDVFTHVEFERQFKRLRKKYHSLVDDYISFLQSIKKNPFQGVELGRGVRKVRMSVASKKRGKSGGMRVITYLVNSTKDDNIEITLLYLYDKSELENVSDKFISFLIKS